MNTAAEIYTVTLRQDKPLPMVHSILKGSNPVDPSDLDIDLRRFLSIHKENSECWRFGAYANLADLAHYLNTKGDDWHGNTRVIRCYKKVMRDGRYQFTVSHAHVKPAPRVEDVPVLPCMAKHMDGAHCGLGDWYPAIEEGIKEALAGAEDFTTGWYSSKKEIASARISRFGDHLHVEVSVSDDFDTTGHGEHIIPLTTNLELVRKAIGWAWDDATHDQEENRTVLMYAVRNPAGNWVETYLIDASGWGSERPPGDNYYQWGWQEECEDIPEEVKKHIEDTLMDKTIDVVKIDGWEATLV